MANEYNRLAMFSAPVADDQVNMLAQPQLPPGHPSNLLMWLRDQIPQVQADDSSTMSGITSRLGRTATAIPRAGLETMANWLQGTHDPNAVRIGEDTIAPLGLFGMAGLAARAPRAAATATRSDAAIARDLAARYPDEIAGGSISRQNIAGGPRMGVVSDEGMTPLTLTRDAMHTPGDFVNRAPPLGRPANLLADNARSSVPGTVVNAMADRPKSFADELRSVGSNREAFSTIMSRLEADKSLKKADWDAIAHAYGGTGGGYSFKNIEQAKQIIRQAFADEQRYAALKTTPVADNALASSPGLAANSTQQDDGAMDIFRRFGLVE